MGVEKDGLLYSIASAVSDLVDRGDIGTLSKSQIISSILERVNLVEESKIGNSPENEIPVEIFSTKLSGLESIVKYLREEYSWTFKRISKELNRSLTTISTSYFNSVKKLPKKFNCSKNSIRVKLTDLSKRPLSVSEALIYSLKMSGLKYVEISKILNRNQRNVWSTYDRAKTKLAEVKDGKKF